MSGYGDGRSRDHLNEPSRECKQSTSRSVGSNYSIDSGVDVTYSNASPASLFRCVNADESNCFSPCLFPLKSSESEAFNQTKPEGTQEEGNIGRESVTGNLASNTRNVSREISTRLMPKTQPEAVSPHSKFSVGGSSCQASLSSSNDGPALLHTDTRTSSGSDNDTEYSTDELTDSLCDSDQCSIHQMWLPANRPEPVLSSVKKEIVDHLMGKFWTCFGVHRKDRASNDVTDAHGSEDVQGSSPRTSNNCASSCLELSSEITKGDRKGKLHHRDGDDSREDQEDRHPKKLKRPLSRPYDNACRLKFACPYRIHTGVASGSGDHVL